jgi:hypothetical protein
MKIAVIESPYRSETDWELRRNLAYARALVAHVTLRGDAPVASHLLITQALDDRDPAQRKRGIEAGLALLRVADVHVFGIDLGISSGMELAIDRSSAEGVQIERLSLPEWAAAFPQFYKLSELVEKWAPKWHEHPRAT